jgi:hypothetical protein
MRRAAMVLNAKPASREQLFFFSFVARRNVPKRKQLFQGSWITSS